MQGSIDTTGRGEHFRPPLALLHQLGAAGRRFIRYLLIAAGSVVLTTALFLVLPLIQAIRPSSTVDLSLQTVEAASIPPPPPPPASEPEKKPEPKEKPPDLIEQAPPLDLSQLELVLNPVFGGRGTPGDYEMGLNTLTVGKNGVDALFALSDLDQKPRVIYQPRPALNSDIRKLSPGKVYVVFVVNKSGRVENPMAQRSTNPVFERSAVAAVSKWRFDPGKRNGKPVRFRMRVPIVFPKLRSSPR